MIASPKVKKNYLNNMQYTTILTLTLGLFFFASCKSPSSPPSPFGAIPSPQQLDWHDLEYYAFVHFNINTFSDVEWGHGKEPASLFNPTALDCRQWARVAKEAGMKGIIITAKHHDGFCLWPSKYSEHSVKNSLWKNGHGDVLKELSEACKEFGLKMGVYLSPWDQNSPIYGTPEYNEYFMKQLEEVLTSYGDIFEVWFDGAVGEEFKGKQIYDWRGFIHTVRKNQPNAVIFSDAGPDIRWVGTEQGFANPTNWSTLNRDDYFPGTPKYLDLRSGNKNGTHWLPAEVDVSIRPGWYYHTDQDDKVKSPEHLELIYYQSVGRNANLLLNLPVDRRGLVHENDVKSLMALKAKLDATFTTDLAAGAKTRASNTRYGRKIFASSAVTDGNPGTYWAADDKVKKATLEILFDKEKTFNVIELREFIPLGQRVEECNVEAWVEGGWKTIGNATTIGYKRLIPVALTTASKIKINILSALACPTLSQISVYFRPHHNYLLESDETFRDRMTWWRDAGLGLFIHWGAYAVPAGNYKGKEVDATGEWIMNAAKIPVPEYEEFVHQFNPTGFKALDWIKIAKQAGMKYIVITSKHHDGFCLWDSDISNYDFMDATPFKIDVIKELSEACKQENIKFGIYHSILDWHHPQATGRTFSIYRENYLKPQLEELVKKYNPDILWFDGDWIDEWTEPQGKDLYHFIRSLKPDIIINNRVGKGRNGMQGMSRGTEFVGDFGTPEQEILEKGAGGIDWESCMTMNDTWGYKLNDDNWKSSETLIHHIVDIAAKGGNFLLNVGPTAQGLIPQPSIKILNDIGNWMQVNGEVVHHTRSWPTFHDGQNIRYILGKNGFCYAVLMEWPGQSANLHHIAPENGTGIELLGFDRKIFNWKYDAHSGLDIPLPEAWQDPANRKCEHAWVLKIKGGYR